VDPLHAAFLVFALVIGALRGYYQWRMRHHRPKRRIASMLDRALIAVAVIAMIPIPLLQIFTPVFVRLDFTLPGLVGWLGVDLLALAALLFWRSHADLGLNWSMGLEVRHGHTLVDRGVYRYIRHPMYAALLVAGLGQFLTLQNWVGGSSIFLAGLVFLVFRVPREERLLLDEFGEAYRTYQARTGRVFPRFSSIF